MVRRIAECTVECRGKKNCRVYCRVVRRIAECTVEVRRIAECTVEW